MPRARSRQVSAGRACFGLPGSRRRLTPNSPRSGRGIAARVEAQLTHRLALLPGRGARRFPDGVARFAASARRQLAGHLEAHAAGHCPTTGVSATRRSSHVA